MWDRTARRSQPSPCLLTQSLLGSNTGSILDGDVRVSWGSAGLPHSSVFSFSVEGLAQKSAFPWQRCRGSPCSEPPFAGSTSRAERKKHFHPAFPLSKKPQFHLLVLLGGSVASKEWSPPWKKSCPERSHRPTQALYCLGEQFV